MSENLFPAKPISNPVIYAYRDKHPAYDGLLQVHYTTGSVEEHIKRIYPDDWESRQSYEVVFKESALYPDGSNFIDTDVHKVLQSCGIEQIDNEWFCCETKDIKSAYAAVRNRQQDIGSRVLRFKMRPEQEEAVDKAAAYFGGDQAGNFETVPQFLWNAKMRFGKSFAAYKLAQKMGWTKILILTFKPGVQNAWEDDLIQHVDFDGWQFLAPNGLSYENVDPDKPLVCFGSFQDYLGKNLDTGGIKAKNEWVHTTIWDCCILDEYHYGAWRENAKDLFEGEGRRELKFAQGEGQDYFNQAEMPITSNHYLYLSGTPFKAIASGEFLEDQIFNWTYSDEQKSKQNWQGKDNPYSALPRMVMMTYQLPDRIGDVVSGGDANEMDLNELFAAEGEGDDAQFIHEDEVQLWLNLIRGASSDWVIGDLKIGGDKPPLPFSDIRLLNLLSHTMWFLPRVGSCFAMRNLLRQRQNRFYKDYRIIVAAGNRAGVGPAALPPLVKAMDNPLQTKTITLSCGKLTTGVTVRPWSGIFMLRNSSSPETYFQAMFRVQSPWAVDTFDDDRGKQQDIIKPECYVFDFCPSRALKQIVDYSTRLTLDEDVDPEKNVEEFISFLPVLAYDGSGMKQLSASAVLDMAMSGTTATLLARRWESTLLVNVDNNTLARLMSDESAMNALGKIEGFRNLNDDIETLINRSSLVAKTRKEVNDGTLTSVDKKKLSEEEKELNATRKRIQQKLIKFATRIPVFMYLTDYRERSLKDVIRELEPGLFERVTGLSADDFAQLLTLNVFNSSLMNHQVLQFKLYEDSSLEYMGVNKHRGKGIGLFDTVWSEEDYSEYIRQVIN